MLSDANDDHGFSRPLVTKLINDLEAVPLKSLTENESEQLLVLIQATLDVWIRLLIPIFSEHSTRLTNVEEPSTPTAYAILFPCEYSTY